jgi:DNA-binding protein Fis
VLYDNGVGRFDTTNLSTVGKAVAKILTIPNKFQNEYVYISEFTVSQNDIFDALLRVTSTKREDWSVEHRTAKSMKLQGLEKLEKQDLAGVYDLIFAAVHQPGLGSDFSSTRKLDNDALGVVKGDLFETTRKIFESM